MLTDIAENELNGSRKHAQSLLNQIQGLHRILEEFAICAPEPCSFSIQKFFQLDVEAREWVLKTIEMFVDVLKYERAEGLVETRSNVESERLRIRRFLQESGLKLGDERILQLFDEDDVIEIYDLQHRQIYRNLNFCKRTTYNLLDIAVNSWMDLYDRPQASLMQIYSRSIEIAKCSKMILPYEMSDYILREKFAYTQNKRTYLLKMKFIGAVLDQQTQQFAAGISILNSQEISASEDVDSVSILA